MKKQGNYFTNRIISKNLITDWVQGIRNLLGLRLKSYENTIQQNTEELLQEMPPMKWYRIDIEQMDTGAFMIAIYGEKE